MKKQWLSLFLILGLVMSTTPPTGATENGGIAFASTQSVEINGTTVEFQAYALKDENGYDTNYVKIRDVALALDGTAAQFNVGWDGAVNLETGKPYTTRNGQENRTPYSGNRPYIAATAVTKVNGAVATLDAFVITDDTGKGSTYYKLRDLGDALGFTAGWTADRGVFIEIECEHQWKAATCEEAAECQICGEARGTAIGHDWTEAGCVTLSTCKICGKTRGTVLGHDWREATCTRPATCSACGETQGAAAGHKWIAATYDKAKTCRVCGETFGEPLERGPSKAEQYMKYKESIDRQISAIKAEGDLYYGTESSYRSEVSSLTSQIASAQSRINSLSLSTDRRDAAERKKYEEQLANLQNELEDLQAAYGRTARVDALRATLDKYYDQLMRN